MRSFILIEGVALLRFGVRVGMVQTGGGQYVTVESSNFDGGFPLSVGDMYLLDLTLSSPAENLALEEALLGWSESMEEECLRLWESDKYFVVLGAGSPLWTDVHVDACRAAGVPVLRRCSGGGTVVQGPGCLNYTLVLDKDRRPELESIGSTNGYILTRIAEAVRVAFVRSGGGADGGDVAPMVRGISDLTVGDLKFSGNAQRRRKRFVLFHGTVLYDFDLGKISECLGRPERMPDYRGERAHKDFITNIGVPAGVLKRAIAEEWGAERALEAWPKAETAELAAGRYVDQKWIASI